MALCVVGNYTLGIVTYLIFMDYCKERKDYSNHIINMDKPILRAYVRVGFSIFGLVGILIGISIHIFNMGKDKLVELREERRSLNKKNW